jgi:hypothetical protein
MSVRVTKRTSSVRKVGSGNMRPEYRFDYSRAKPNRFAKRAKGGVVAVLLEPDVAAVFKSSESVNAVLRSIISVVPRSSSRRASGPRKAV